MIPEAIKKDAMKQAGSIYHWNAPHAIGYLFTNHKNGKEVATGMYCSNKDEIKSEQWDGFLSFKKKEFFDLNIPRSSHELENL